MTRDIMPDLNLKVEIIETLRDSAATITGKAISTFADQKKRAAYVNGELLKERWELIDYALELAEIDSWTEEQVLSTILLITYCSYVVMLEARNSVWPYEYMAFARRIGELWEPFCLLCWDYPVKSSITISEPPHFLEVQAGMKRALDEYIGSLGVEEESRTELLSHYDSVWKFASSGEIQLKSDLHFNDGSNEYVVDFKSGFSSNEKGNTNRLLMVASIYAELENYKCLLFVRSEEDSNNHYLQTLKRSGKWEVYCGADTYRKIHDFTGFDLLAWIRLHMDWANDFTPEMYQYLKANRLEQYIEW